MLSKNPRIGYSGYAPPPRLELLMGSSHAGVDLETLAGPEYLRPPPNNWNFSCRTLCRGSWTGVWRLGDYCCIPKDTVSLLMGSMLNIQVSQISTKLSGGYLHRRMSISKNGAHIEGQFLALFSTATFFFVSNLEDFVYHVRTPKTSG